MGDSLKSYAWFGRNANSSTDKAAFFCLSFAARTHSHTHTHTYYAHAHNTYILTEHTHTITQTACTCDTFKICLAGQRNRAPKCLPSSSQTLSITALPLPHPPFPPPLLVLLVCSQSSGMWGACCMFYVQLLVAYMMSAYKWEYTKCIYHICIVCVWYIPELCMQYLPHTILFSGILLYFSLEIFMQRFCLPSPLSCHAQKSRVNCLIWFHFISSSSKREALLRHGQPRTCPKRARNMCLSVCVCVCVEYGVGVR